MDFRILGPLEVLAGGRSVALGGAKARALLAFLLLNRGETVARERLVDELWGEQPPKAVAAELRVYVAKLRKAIGAAAVVTRPGGYALMADADAVDAWRFERDARRGAALLGARDLSAAARVLGEALALWRGPVLADLSPAAWSEPEAHRLEELRMIAVEDRLEADLALGRQLVVVPELERLVREHPYRERLRAQLMLALYRCGRQADALELHRETARFFRSELGIEPGAELRRLERAILNHDPALAASEVFTGNLPTPPTPLVGRERELEELAALLRQPQTRLVTVTGAGGTGKTRLSIDVAAQFESDVGVPAFFVELAPLADPSLVLAAIAEVVGVERASRGSLRANLRTFLRHRPVLLVLDNFEHVADAAGEVARLLAEAGSVRVLATSRAPLHVRPERVYELNPLPLDDALALFLERIRAMQPFEVTVAIANVSRRLCERLDRLPLAIELAAARAEFLDATLVVPPTDRLLHLDGRYRDLPDRQRTLWATIDWSYRLLAHDERRLFARLSVFRGSFSREAAQAVCDAEPDRLAALVDARLVVRRGDRFRLLETIREFAVAMCEIAERETTRQRHAGFFLARARDARLGLTGPDAAVTLAQLELDLDNLRVAFDWWVESKSCDELLIYVNSLSRLFSANERADEGLAWISRALERIRALGTAVTPRLHVVALIRAGSLEWGLGDRSRARARYEQALLLAREHGDAAGESAALTGLVTVADVSDSGALEMQEHAVAIARTLGDERELVIGLHSLASRRFEAGDLDAAAAILEETIGIERKLGDVLNEAVSVLMLANVALEVGDVDRALDLFRHGVRIGQRLRSWWLAGGGVEGIAAAMLADGAHPVGVLRLIGASEALFAAGGRAEKYCGGYLDTVSGGGGVENRKGIIEAQAREALDAAQYDHVWADGRALTPESAVELALSLSEPSSEAAIVAAGAQPA